MGWPEEKWEFVTKDVFPHFRQFTRSALQAKEERERRNLREIEHTSTHGRPSRRRSTQLGELTYRPPRRSPKLARRLPEQNRGGEEEEESATLGSAETSDDEGSNNNNNDDDDEEDNN